MAIRCAPHTYITLLIVQDTIVRYSAAKYLARITASLPEGFQEQIVSATLALFGGTDDEPVIESSFNTIVDPGGSGSGGTMGFGGAESLRGDARWHGVCLALAELARRGLVREEVLGETVTWILKVGPDLTSQAHADARPSLSIYEERPTRSEPMYGMPQLTCCGHCRGPVRHLSSSRLQPISLPL